MKLSEFLKLYCAANSESIPSELNEIKTDFRGYTDQTILTDVIRNKIIRENIFISNGIPASQVTPTMEEIKEWIEGMIEFREDFLSLIFSQIDIITRQSSVSLSMIKTSLINKYIEKFSQTFYSPGNDIVKDLHNLKGLGYYTTLQTDMGAVSFILLKNGKVPEGQIDHRGWKIHISIMDDKNQARNKENLCKAWNAIVSCFYKFQVERVKIVGSAAIEDFKSQDPYSVGKQITIYANQFINNPAECERLLRIINLCLIKQHIKPSYRPKGDKPIKGSSYLSYRYDTYKPGSDRHGKRRDAELYAPDGLQDPFIDFQFIFRRQRKSRGYKTVNVVQLSEKQKRLLIPTLTLSGL